MEHSMKESLKREKSMDKEHINGVMEVPIQAGGSLTTLTALVNISGLMAAAMRVPGRTTSFMDVELISGQMAESMKENM